MLGWEGRPPKRTLRGEGKIRGYEALRSDWVHFFVLGESSHQCAGGFEEAVGGDGLWGDDDGDAGVARG